MKKVYLWTVRDALALKLKDKAQDRNVAALKQHVPDHLWGQIPVVLDSLAVSGSAGFVVPDDSPQDLRDVLIALELQGAAAKL